MSPLPPTDPARRRLPSPVTRRRAGAAVAVTVAAAALALAAAAPRAAAQPPLFTLVGRWSLGPGAPAGSGTLCPTIEPLRAIVGAGFSAASELYVVARCGQRAHLAVVTAAGVVNRLGVLDAPDLSAAAIDPKTHRLLVSGSTSGGRYGVRALPINGSTYPERTWNNSGNATDPDSRAWALAAGDDGVAHAFSLEGVARFGPGAERRSPWPVLLPDRSAAPPRALAVDAAGAVYLTASGLAGVQKHDAGGRVVDGWAVDGLVAGGALAGFAAGDHLAVVENAAGGAFQVRRFDTDGRTLAVHPVDGRITGGAWPMLAVGPGGQYAALRVQPPDAVQLAWHAADGSLAVYRDLAPAPRTVTRAPLRVGTAGGSVAAALLSRAIARWAPDGRSAPAIDAGPIDDLALLDGGDIAVVRPLTATALASAVERRDGDGRVVWTAPLPHLAAGLAAHGDALYALAADEAVVTVVAATDGAVVGRLPLAGDGFLPVDLAAGPDGVTVVDPFDGRIEVWSPSVPFRPIRRLALPIMGSDARVAAGPAGLTALVAQWRAADGSAGPVDVRVVDAEGAVVWRMSDVPGLDLSASTPLDVAFGADGRLVVGTVPRAASDWGTSAEVVVFDLAAEVAAAPPPTPAPLPPPPPANGGPCRVAGDKTAAPREIWLGETVTVTLSIGRACPDVSTVADIVLVVDVSGSMGGGKERAAAAAVEAFVGDIDLDRHRVGLVTFSHVADLRHPLSHDPAVVRDVPNSYGASGGTDIAAALVLADAHLLQAARPEARQVIVLVSDGGSAADPAMAAALAARRRGVRIFTVGVAGADNRLLLRIAGRPEQHYGNLKTEDLPALYRQLATLIASGAGAAVLDDVLGPDVDLVPGTFSLSPQAVFGDGLRWGFGADAAAPVTLTYQVRPLRTGLVPTNTSAWYDYLDGDGVVRRFTYPVPEVLVRAPTPTPPPPTPTPPPPPTPQPRPIYLPIALREAACLPAARHVDVVLVVDASTSMEEPAPSGRSKRAVALDGVRGFLARLDLAAPGAPPPAPEVGDRAAIVAFNAGATLLQGLTADRAALEGALGAVAVAPQTCIACGLEAAVAALADARRGPGLTPAIVLLTDGRSNPRPIADAEAVAADARARGIVVFTIALGADVEAEALARMASQPAYAYRAPSADDLAAIYAAVAGAIPCPPAAHWGGR